MGSGKSEMGKILSQQLNLNWFDMDSLLEKEIGLSIDTIFSDKGEDWFRRKESALIQKGFPEGVISTGGGIVESEVNRKILSRTDSLTIWLDLPWDVLRKRIINSKRPLVRLLDSKALYQLYKKRRSLYASCADIIVEHNDIDKIIALIQLKISS